MGHQGRSWNNPCVSCLCASLLATGQQRAVGATCIWKKKTSDDEEKRLVVVPSLADDPAAAATTMSQPLSRSGDRNRGARGGALFAAAACAAPPFRFAQGIARWRLPSLSSYLSLEMTTPSNRRATDGHEEQLGEGGVLALGSAIPTASASIGPPRPLPSQPGLVSLDRSTALDAAEFASE